MKNKKCDLDSDNLGLKFIFDFPNPILITHGDVDGLCAAALLLREFKLNGLDVPVYITQPFSLHYLLKSLLKAGLNGNLIVVDLALTKKSIDLLPAGSIVIDHHPSTEEFTSELKSKRIHFDVNTDVSASQLCYNLVTENKFNKYLAKLGGVGDRKIISKRLGKQAMMLSAAMSLNHKDDDFRSTIIFDFVAGKYVREMKEVKFRSKEAFKILDTIKNSGELLYEGPNIIVKFYENGFSRASVLASKLSVATKKVAFVLTLMKGNSNLYLITGRSPERNHEPLLNIRDFIDDFNYCSDGGGLVKAASCTIKKSLLKKFIEHVERADKKVLTTKK